MMMDGTGPKWRAVGSPSVLDVGPFSAGQLHFLCTGRYRVMDQHGRF